MGLGVYQSFVTPRPSVQRLSGVGGATPEVPFLQALPRCRLPTMWSDDERAQTEQ